MKKQLRRVAVLIMAFALSFTSLPLMTGGLDAFAASGNTAVLSWKALTKKQQKKVDGIAVFRKTGSGKYVSVKNMKKSAKTWKNTGLKAM